MTPQIIDLLLLSLHVVAKIRLLPHSLVCILSRIICCTHIRVPIVVGNPQRTFCNWRLIILLPALLDKGIVVCATFIDLRKAFDSLDHYLLLQRISKPLGVHYEVLEWFKDHLSDHYHRVK